MAQLRRLRSQGAPYAKIVPIRDGPLIELTAHRELDRA